MRSMVLACLFVCCALAQASRLHVPADYGTIQEALDSSAPLDTVLVSQGTYFELLTTPDWEVTLASNYIFSQDTTDIQETILDGNYEGTVIEVFTQTPSVFHLKGFTVQRGEGYFNNSWDKRAGGFQLHPDVSIDFQDLVFRQNRGFEGGGAVTRQVGSISRNGSFALRRVHIHDNELLNVDSYQDCTLIVMEGKGIIEDLVIRQNQGSDGHLFFADSGIEASRVHMLDGEIVQDYVLRFKSDSVTTVRDIFIRNCHRDEGGLLGLEGDSLFIRNVHITDNLSNGQQYGFSNQINGISYLDIDSLYIQRNRVLFQGDAAGSISGRGTIRNLHVTDNVVGDSLVQNARGSIIDIANANVFDSEFSRNVILNGPSEDGEAHWGGNVVSCIAYVDTVRWINCRFEDNYTHDPDDYTQIQNPRPDLGRVLYHNILGITEYMEMRNCVFRNNRQPNHAPEWAGMDLFHRSVGSTVELIGSSASVRYYLENILVEDCDDGGIALSDHNDELEAVNLVVRRTGRFGLIDFGDDELILRNCLFEDIDVQDNYMIYPYTDSYQGVIQSGVHNNESILENVTIHGCDMDKLFTGGFNFENSLLWDNAFAVLSATNDQPVFSYSLVQQGMNGTNNIQDDPFFDSELGPPYLSPASSAIDAGNPNPVYNDVEDPDSPGFALWPSQGGIRNDMGYTGGPGARELDPQVSVTPKETPTLPASIALHPAWPNPFNPATTVAFDLPNSAPVTLAVYNLRGQKVRTLVQNLLPAGRHEVVFRAEGLASGVYFLRLAALGEVRTGKVLLLK